MGKAQAPAPAPSAAPAAASERRGAAQRRKDKRMVPHGVANIQASFNNTVISICDPDGNVITWSSAGRAGFKGSRKGTPFAAQVAAQNAGHQARDHGVRTVDVLVRGPGAGRESAIRALQTTGIDVKSIRDVTPIPHNGCRPRKRRRV
jgi:small subunit ribosomal protein S11